MSIYKSDSTIVSISGMAILCIKLEIINYKLEIILLFLYFSTFQPVFYLFTFLLFYLSSRPFYFFTFLPLLGKASLKVFAEHFDRQVAAAGIVTQLVFANLSKVEIASLGVGEHES